MLLRAMVLILALAAAPAAVASGTVGASEGAFGARNQDAGAGARGERAALDSATTDGQSAARELYARGRNVYSRQLACNSCVMPDGVRSADAAVQLITRLDAGEFDFTLDDRQALTTYLVRRFRLVPAEEQH